MKASTLFDLGTGISDCILFKRAINKMGHAIYRLIFSAAVCTLLKENGSNPVFERAGHQELNIDKISDKNCKGDITQEKFTTVICKGN